jgi:uncharacterized protein YjbJ (UPF0337 family)
MGEHMDKTKGKIKQAAGVLTGNEKLKREGKRDEVKGKVEGVVDDAKDEAKDEAKRVKKAFTPGKK